MPRLFNHPAEHFFLGRIHEQLIGSRPVRLDESVIMLRHWGYQQSRVAAKGKANRNRTLLDTEAAEGASLRTALYQAAAAPTPAESLAKAREAMTHIIPGTPANVGSVVTGLILQALVQMKEWDMVLEEAETLLERLPTLDAETQYWQRVGEAHVGLGDEVAAEAAFRKAWERLGDHRTLQAHMTELVPAAAALSLSTMLMKRGEMGETRQILETVLQEKRLSRKTRSRLQAALASPMAVTGDPERALQVAQEALTTLPELRATIANSFIEHGQPVLAMKLMAPILDPLVLRDRVMTMAASLMGDLRAIELLDWLQAATTARSR
jgi:thioredoxin-like negative regulator of GroEL